MQKTNFHRIRRRNPSHETFAKKDNKLEQPFFGGLATGAFFQPAAVIQRKCENCEKDDKKVQRQTDTKEEERVMKKQDKKDENKIMKKEEMKDEEKIHKKDTGSNASPTITGSYINTLQSKGSHLPTQAQQFFSSKMGYNFSHVKIHTDKEAAESAKDVNAKAYTVGNNIVFNEGQYNTESGEGKKLMAHELVHVIQQQSDSTRNINPELLQRKVSYPRPAYTKEDPIPKIIGAGGGRLGETFITLNGVKLNTKLNAMKAIFEAFNNYISLVHDPVTKTCCVDTTKVDIKMSAAIKHTTDPVKDKWSGVYPGRLVSGSAVCSKLPSVNIEMVSVPSGGALLAGSVWIDEMQHYTDILDISKKHIEAFHTYLDNLSFSTNTLADCPLAFSTVIGNKDITMATAFADDWLAAVQTHDKPGGAHHYSSVTNATNCNLVTVTVSF
jgi:hypothetical protein